MDAAILAQLDSATIDETIALATAIEKSAAELQQLRDRIANAQATLQAAQANSPQALADLKTLVTIGDKLVGVSANLQKILNLSPATLTARIQAVKASLGNAATLTAPAIQGLADVLAVYDRLQQLRKGEVKSAKAFLTEFATSWLNKEREIGDKGKVKFVTAIGAQSPFNNKAQLSAELDYSVITLIADNLFLTVDSNDTLIPDFSSVKIRSDLNLDSFADEIAGAIAKNLPGGPKLSKVDIKPESPPKITLRADFAGLPVFSTLAFGVDLEINTTGTAAITGASGGLQTFLFPIPGTVVALSTLTVGFNQSQNALSVSTKIVPTADTTGATIALAPLTVLFPLNDLENGVGFSGSLTLLGQECGAIEKGKLSASLIKATVNIPTADSPFGGIGIFELRGSFQIDSKGITFPASPSVDDPTPQEMTVTYLRFIKGKATAAFLFNGSGNVDCRADANATVANATATFAAEWAPGFADLDLNSTAKVSLSVRGFSQITASATVSARVQNKKPSAEVSAKILGVPINLKMKQEDFEAFNLQSFLERELQQKLSNIGELLFKQGEKLINELGDQLSSGIDSLKVAIGSLAPFFDDANKAIVAGAEELKKKGEEAIKEVKDAAEKAARDAQESVAEAEKKGRETVKGWAKKAKKGLGFSLLQEDGSLLPDATLPPLPGILADDFLQNFDTFFDALPLANFANKLAAALVSENNLHDEDDNGGPSLDRIESVFDVRFDQVVVGADEIDHTQSKATTAYVAFFLTGSSFSRRRRNEVRADFAQWGHVKFFDSGPGGILASISVTLQGQPLVDASLLNSRYKIYNRLKEMIVAISPAIRFGDKSHPNGDPNDPGIEPKIDLFFDQPPSGQLPVLGSLGISAKSFGPTGTTIIKLIPNGAASVAGLKETKVGQKGDIITKINGIATGVDETVPVEERDVIKRVLTSTTFDRAVKLKVLSQSGANAGTEFEKTILLDPVT